MDWYESLAERRIREAQERGEFDNLPGAGKPLDLGDPYDEDWWLKSVLRRENLDGSAVLPPALLLRKEAAGFPESLSGIASEAAVREVLHDYNRRVKADRLARRWAACHPCSPGPLTWRRWWRPGGRHGIPADYPEQHLTAPAFRSRCDRLRDRPAAHHRPCRLRPLPSPVHGRAAPVPRPAARLRRHPHGRRRRMGLPEGRRAGVRRRSGVHQVRAVARVRTDLGGPQGRLSQRRAARRGRRHGDGSGRHRTGHHERTNHPLLSRPASLLSPQARS